MGKGKQLFNGLWHAVAAAGHVLVWRSAIRAAFVSLIDVVVAKIAFNLHVTASSMKS